MFSAWIKLFLGLFCFNLDLPPGTVLKISPINGIATSLKQLFVFFSVTQKCDQSGSKPRNLITCKWQRPQLSCTCWKNPWTRSSDGFQRDARGRVTAGHGRTDTQGEVCASVSRHSRKRSGPHGTADSPTTRGGSLSPRRLFLSWAAPPARMVSQRPSLSLHGCLALERLQFRVVLSHKTIKRDVCQLSVNVQNNECP